MKVPDYILNFKKNNAYIDDDAGLSFVVAVHIIAYFLVGFIFGFFLSYLLFV